MFPFLLPTPHVIDKPPEFLVAGIEYVVFWLGVEGQLNSFPYWKENWWEAGKSWPNFYAVVVPQWRRNQPLDSKPGLSGIPLLSIVPLLLSVFCTPLPPIVSTPLVLPLFGLDIPDVPFFPVVKAGFPS